MDGMCQWCYVMSYDELYALFDKKGWIHSRDREDYGIDNEAEELPTPISKPKSESQPESEKMRHQLQTPLSQYPRKYHHRSLQSRIT